METERTSGSGEEELLRVSCVDYYTFARLSWETSVRYYYRFNEHYVGNYSFPETFLDDIRSHCSVLPVDLGFVVLLAFLWTSLRIWMSDRVFVVRRQHCRCYLCGVVLRDSWRIFFGTAATNVKGLNFSVAK